MATRNFLFALLIAAAFCVAAADDDVGDIHVLSAADYDGAVNDGSVWFIKYFAPWCGHCRRLEPTWKDLAAEFKLSKSIKIGRVDCTTDRDVCTSAEVKGYPTLNVVHNGEKITAYRGQRELDALKAFITEQAEKLLTETTE